MTTIVSSEVVERLAGFCDRRGVTPEAVLSSLEEAGGVPEGGISGATMGDAFRFRERAGERSFRRQLQKWADAKPEMKTAIEQVLNDDIQFDLLYDQIKTGAGLYVDDNLMLGLPSAGGDGQLVDNLLKFFQWVLDHQDQILSFIKAIVAMFGV